MCFTQTGASVLLVCNPVDRVIADYVHKKKRRRNKMLEEIVLDREGNVDTQSPLLRPSIFDERYRLFTAFFLYFPLHDILFILQASTQTTFLPGLSSSH